MKAKRFLSTVVAGALVAAQMAMPVMAADGGQLDVEVETKTAVIRVVVPTSMQIAVNQFEMGDAGSQLYSSDFTMENKSEIPVKVSVTSTATLKTGSKLLETKAEAGASAKAGEAWLAVAAQTTAGDYKDIDAGATPTPFADLTEESANVATFEAGGTVSQTFYLDGSTTMGYKLLNANEDASGIAYAQFYELTAITVADQDALDAELAKGDVYSITTADIADGKALTKVADDGSGYAAAKTFYKASIAATDKKDIDATKLYMYGDGTTATDGKAGFRYIGKLSGAQETWTKDDISKIVVKYDITGVASSKYAAVAPSCTYGLYHAPVPTATPTEFKATVKETVITNIPDGAALTKVELVKPDKTVVEMASGTQYTFDAETGKFAIVKDVLVSETYAGGKYVLTFGDSKVEIPVVK